MRKITAAALALFAAFAIMSLAFAGQATIAQDDPPRLLDANYHDLPQDLVDKLRANPPGRPYGLAIDENCYTLTAGGRASTFAIACVGVSRPAANWRTAATVARSSALSRGTSASAALRRANV